MILQRAPFHLLKCFFFLTMSDIHLDYMIVPLFGGVPGSSPFLSVILVLLKLICIKDQN